VIGLVGKNMNYNILVIIYSKASNIEFTYDLSEFVIFDSSR